MAGSTTKSDRRTIDNNERIRTLEAEFARAPDKGVDRLAQAYLEEGRPRDAIRVLEKHTNGKDGGRKILLAQAWFDLFDNDRARQLLDEAGKAGGVEDNARALLLSGELAFEAGRADDARKHLLKVRSLNPKNRRAAQLLQSLGEDVEVPEAPEGEPALVGFRTEDETAESASRAGLQVLIGLVVGAVVLGGYYWWSQHAHAAKMLSVAGAELAESADANALRMAEQRFLEALDHQSGNEYAVAGLAEVYTLLWVDHGFADAKETALEYVAAAKDDDIEKAERYGAEILAAYGLGNYDEAQTIAAAVVEKGAVSEKIYYGLGLALRAAGKDRQGRDYLRRAYDLKGDASHYAADLGDAYDDDNDERNAAFFWGIAARNGAYVRGVARSIIGQVRQGKDLEPLVTELERLDKLAPEQVGARDKAAIELARAALLHRQGKSKEALAAVDQAIAIEGETARALAMRGDALISDGKADEGIGELKKAHSKRPGALRYLYGLVDAYMAGGKHEEAVNTLRVEAGELAQDHAYYVALGNAYREKGDHDKALESYDKALKLYENYFDALLGTGVVYWRQKKYDEATEWLRKAVAAKEAPEVYEAVGLMWIERGYLDDADIQVVEAEKRFLARGTANDRMQKFYGSVIGAYGKARGGSSLVRKWVERETAFRKGG